ncbi:MAG TPA: hypothetical protein VHG10_01660 [Glycomyces sp.]|nr:hypothetical protein [Glycomyces sp.]
MDGGRQVGLFGAIGRETKGAARSLGYDLRRSPRFRRIGAIAVATMAGGVLAAGTLLQGDQVPQALGLDRDDDSDITGGWFGLGADTTGQDAESSESETTAPDSEAADPESATESETDVRGRGGSGAGTPIGSPGLVPVDETSGPGEEESGTTPPGQKPTEAPSTDEPTTDTPTEEPTWESPTAEEPSPSDPAEPSESVSPSESTDASAEQAARRYMGPTPRKGLIRS